MVLAAVREDGRAIQYASEALRADREVVLAAVQQNDIAFAYASKDLREDRETVLAAVREKGDALFAASDDLHADREVVLAAVRQNGWALQFADDNLRADREIVLAAVKQSGSSLQFARGDLCADREVVLAAVQQHGTALCYAHKGLFLDREVMLAAIQQDGRAFQFADKSLQQDEQFAAELADVCPLGDVWCYKPQVTLAGIARKAMRSKGGLLLLAEQARASLLGEPAMMKELLLSALEQGCLEDTLQMLLASQKKGILDALRTIMAWYGMELPDALPADMDSLNAFCATLSKRLVSEK